MGFSFLILLATLAAPAAPAASTAPASFTDTVRAVVVHADAKALDACVDLHSSTVKPVDGMIWSLYCQSIRLEQPASFLKRLDQLELCWRTAGALSEAAPTRPESFYFAALCLAQKSYAGGVVSQIAMSRQVLRLFGEAETRGTDKHPVVARAKMAKALFLRRLPGRHDNAEIEELTAAALRAQPNLMRLKIWYAQTLEEQGRLAEAMAQLREALAKTPEETSAFWEANLLDHSQAGALLKQWQAEASASAAPQNQETEVPSEPR